MTILLALAIGIVAGSRSMLAPAVVSWAAMLGLLPLEGTPMAWLSQGWIAWMLTALAAVELIGDQLPTTPSRTEPVPFGFRIVSGTLCGLALAVHQPVAGVVAGVAGAVIGTLGGRAARRRLAEAFKSDHPGAFLEDAIAIAGAVCVVALSR